MRLINIQFKSFWRDVLAPIVAAICVITIVVLFISRVCDTSDDCDFCPVTLTHLEVEPETIRIGETITLQDGLCSSWDSPLSTQIYLGAESVGTTSFATRSIDLLSRDVSGQRVPATDSPEGRLRRTLEPGCTFTEPIIAPLPTAFTPGLWQLKAHIIIVGPEGQTQDIVKISNPFRVIE